MSVREKVIIVLTLLVAVYGGYTLLFSGKSPTFSGSRSEQMADRINKAQQLVGVVSTQINATRPITDFSKYIVERAAYSWESDPLIKTYTPLDFEPKKIEKEIPQITADELGVKYTGYIKIGEKLLAIINESEYEVGDELRDKTGFFVKSITKGQVVLEQEGTTSKVIVPLQEEVRTI